MTKSNAYRLPHMSDGTMRVLSGGTVLLLHVLVVLVLLLHMHATRPLVLPSQSLILLTLKPDAPVLEPKPVVPTRSFAAPSVSLTFPTISISPRETRGVTVPETVAPVASAPGVTAPAERKSPTDLFSDEKKEEFRRFFKQQAIEDQRENTRVAGVSDHCNVFRKQGEPDMPDMQTAPNGIAKSFVPAFGIGIHIPDDHKVYLEACN